MNKEIRKDANGTKYNQIAIFSSLRVVIIRSWNNVIRQNIKILKIREIKMANAAILTAWASSLGKIIANSYLPLDNEAIIIEKAKNKLKIPKSCGL